jgi:aryl sulfotransferase
VTVRPPQRRYRSVIEDSARWLDFAFRDGDIVISTRSKHGTTWLQMICALLIFRSPDLPAPLPELSPWLDWLVLDEEEVSTRLAAQPHRRFIKSHTPLDGLPIDERVTYVVGARHPLDAALSLYHQGRNLDHDKISELIGHAVGPGSDYASPTEWLAEWVRRDRDPADDMDGIRGVFWHLGDAWARRDDDNLVLVHFEDLLTDLPGEMARVADRLGISLSVGALESLASAATFDAMRGSADRLAPAPDGVFLDRGRFFRSGGMGDGRAVADAETLALYEQRARELAPGDLLEWLHR